ncbi:MAG: hypothetical protein HOQ24_13570 [Mycobacteriaceae bacterium]|nr:hypothetical protein [Mycobacteriaceae bacterium]
MLALLVPVLVGLVATAQSDVSAAAAGRGNAGLSWMNIKDTAGVRLSDYAFTTNNGSLLHPDNTALALVLQLEFSGWLVIVTTAIWIIGYVLSFQWLDLFSTALQGVADALTGTIATPIMLMTAAAIGAFFVGWFVVRGRPAKATAQVVTMLAVAVAGPMFLAEPLADVLSSHGLLSEGRDLGISVAAGLNGNSTPNPTQLVASMQGTMADNFARLPLQVWNFGHVVDDQPGCGAAWSAGVSAGKADSLKENLKHCGDTYAHATAMNPGAGQIATGLILLICGTVLVLFAAYLAIRVIWAALDTVYHGFMSIFGFAAGGFVYGPTQTFLIRNIVDGFIAAARMAVYTIFLGVYVLFLGNLFRQAHGQVMAIFVIGGLVEIVAILQLRRLSNGLNRGNEWIANRFALATQGVRGGAGGSGSGTALGMGEHGASRGMGVGSIAALAAISTIDSNPLTGWIFQARSPLQYMARRRQHAERINADLAISGWPMEQQRRLELDRQGYEYAAERRRRRSRGGMGLDNALTVAEMLDGVIKAGAPSANAGSVLEAIGVDRRSINRALRVMEDMRGDTSVNPFFYQPLQKAAAAVHTAAARHNSPDAAAYQAQAVVSIGSWRGKCPLPMMENVEMDFVNRVHGVWDSPINLRNAVTDAEWLSVHPDTLRYLGHELGEQARDSGYRFWATPDDHHLRDLQNIVERAHNLDMITGPLGRGPWTY